MKFIEKLTVSCAQVVLMLCAKAFAASTAFFFSVDTLLDVARNTYVIEWILWSLLSGALIIHHDNRRWYRSTYRHSTQENLQVDDSGASTPVITCSFSASSDYEQARLAWRRSGTFVVLLSLAALAATNYALH